MRRVEGGISIMAECGDDGSINDIVALWGDRLRAIPPALVPAGVSPETTQFLTTVGLPTAKVQGIAFVHDERISRPIEHLGRGYLFIAETYDGLPYGIDLADGRIGRLIGGRRARAVFVNSSLPQFLIALGTWDREVWRPTVAGRTIEAGFAANERFEAALRDHDPAALGDGAYWPQLLDSIYDGAEL
jgi:SUKH-4 immunity protein